MQLRHAIVVLVLGACALACSGGSSSGSTSSRSRILSPEEAYSTLSGCCSGAGGTYSQSGQNCVIPSEHASAYEGCVGEFDVRYPSGNVEHVSGSRTVRAM